MYMFEKKNEKTVSPETATEPGNGSTPTSEPTVPALAMVYSPRQYWRDVYSPVEALDRGTLFGELDKPLTGVCAGGDAS